jgi:aspartyl-tRNA(Asn)/glutamyl-tRNA(Gln) amidotransferase subunit A
MSPPQAPLLATQAPTAAELVAAFAAGTTTPVDALRTTMRRLEAVNPMLNAVVTVDPDGAYEAALAATQRWERGQPASALDGVPITVKDNIPVAGLRCTWGSRLFADHVPAHDETAVARLRAAGCVIVGKTNVPEFTVQGYTDNLLFGPTGNPYDPALTPGGSSGGAVASVASGIVPLAIGTDGGGSIRRPSGHTGLVGLKPTLGLIGRAHALPPLMLDYEVIGPIARTVQDVALALQVMQGADSAIDLESPPATPLRILHVRHATGPDGPSPVDPQITRAIDGVAQQLRQTGHAVTVAERFDLPHRANTEVFTVLAQAGLLAVLRQRCTDLGQNPDEDWRGLIHPSLEAMADAGAGLTGAQVIAAQQAAMALREDAEALFQRFDLILTPATAAQPWDKTRIFPPTIDGQAVGPRGHAIFTAWVNATGLPGIAQPAGVDSQGLPIGLQLVGPHRSESLLIALAQTLAA